MGQFLSNVAVTLGLKSAEVPFYANPYIMIPTVVATVAVTATSLYFGRRQVRACCAKNCPSVLTRVDAAMEKCSRVQHEVMKKKEEENRSLIDSMKTKGVKAGFTDWYDRRKAKNAEIEAAESAEAEKRAVAKKLAEEESARKKEAEKAKKAAEKEAAEKKKAEEKERKRKAKEEAEKKAAADKGADKPAATAVTSPTKATATTSPAANLTVALPTSPTGTAASPMAGPLSPSTDPMSPLPPPMSLTDTKSPASDGGPSAIAATNSAAKPAPQKAEQVLEFFGKTANFADKAGIKIEQKWKHKSAGFLSFAKGA